MGLFIRTIGIERAKAAITLANMVYNMGRLRWLLGNRLTKQRETTQITDGRSILAGRECPALPLRSSFGEVVGGVQLSDGSREVEETSGSPTGESEVGVEIRRLYGVGAVE